MQKLLLSLFTLIGVALCAHGQPQNWKYVGDNFSGTENIVHVGLVNDKGTALTPILGLDWLGAFIDGECRGVAQATYAETDDGDIYYFRLRIKGTADDNGKAVTFRYLTGADSYSCLEYNLSATKPLTYTNEATIGTLSDLFTLVYVRPISFSFPEKLSVKVGETINLMEQFKWTPENASHPIKIDWDFSNSAQYINVENDVLTGLAPTKYPAYLGYNLQSIKTEGDRYFTEVEVIRTLTDLKLKDEYLKGDTVFVNDSTTLTDILLNCYIKTPTDANEKLTWTCSDPTAMTYYVDANYGEHYNPVKPGHYTLTLSGENVSVQMELTVMNRLEKIEPTLWTYHVFVGDNVADLLPHGVTFTPSEWVNTSVEYTVHNDTANALQYNSDQSIIAVKPGTGFINVIPKELPNDYVSITVFVQPNVTGVSARNSELNFEYKEGGEDITAQLLDNFVFTADKTYRPKADELSSSNERVCLGPINNNFGGYSFITGELGSADIRFTKDIYHTALASGNKLATDTFNLRSTFTVNVVEGLSGFAFDEVDMGRDETRVITLTPEPAEANYNADSIRMEIVPDNFPDGWVLATATKGDDNLHWTVTPKAVGYGVINVYYGQKLVSSKSIDIGQSLTQQAGWKWVALYYGRLGNNLQKVYGDALQEMRSQTQVMYNDPKYGYFGDLSTMSPGQAYKVHVKDGQSINTYYSGGGYTYDNINIPLGLKWNWIGFAYQFDHPVADVLKNVDTLTKGDRIVSKDHGFAEFNGQAWEGSLTTLIAGEGYLYFNNAEGEMTLYPTSEGELGQPQSEADGAMAFNPHSDVWQYSSAQFADNMTIVADLGAEYADSRYTIGAYVGDECRGEGSCVNGKWFITVHGDATQRQQITFRLYDTMTGTMRQIEGSCPFAMMAGSLSAPIRLNVGATTGIEILQGKSSSDNKVQLLTIDGKHVVGAPVPGVYIVKDGATVRKVIVK